MSTRSERTADKLASAATQTRLKTLLRLPANKTCSECKRNDPRWSAWNIGNFVCIRCSGVLRSMGTHIAKVKSVDLDVWTVEQVGQVERWGNKRVNAYWEAHLKPGHVPPEHKIDSFIRSKYESRRWALNGPPPADPAALDQEGDARERESVLGVGLGATTATAASAHQALASANSLGRASSANQAVSSTGSSKIDLFGDDTFTSSLASNLEAKKLRAAGNIAGGRSSGLLDLAPPSLSAPVSTSASRSGSIAALAKPNKADILSLYGSAKSPPPTTNGGQASPGLFDDRPSDDIFSVGSPSVTSPPDLTSSLGGLSLGNDWGEEVEGPPAPAPKSRGSGLVPKTLPLPPSLKMPIPEVKAARTPAPVPAAAAPMPTYRMNHPAPPPPIQPNAFAATAMSTSSAFHGGLSPPKTTNSLVPKDFPTGFGAGAGLGDGFGAVGAAPVARKRGDSLGRNAWSDEFDSFATAEPVQPAKASAPSQSLPLSVDLIESMPNVAAYTSPVQPLARAPVVEVKSRVGGGGAGPVAVAGGWDDFSNNVWNATSDSTEVGAGNSGSGSGSVAATAAPEARKASMEGFRTERKGSASAAIPTKSAATTSRSTGAGGGWSSFDSSPWAEDGSTSPKESRGGGGEFGSSMGTAPAPAPSVSPDVPTSSFTKKAATLDDIYADWS